MTCIAAIRDLNGNIYVGGDSMISSYPYVGTIAKPKIFMKEKMVFGFTGYSRAAQVLEHQFEIPEQHPKCSDYDYLVSVFIDELIKKFLDAKSIVFESNLTMLDNTQFLLAYNRKIYTIESNFQITEELLDYDAIGCGADFAKAVFWLLKDNKEIEPDKKVIKALECATNFSLVGPPFHIIKLESDSGINIY